MKPLVPLTFQTDRLLFRQFHDSDLDAYADMNADPEVRRYLDGRVLERDQAWREMAMFLGHWELRGYGLWAAELKRTGEFVGRIGLNNPEGWPGLEVGWALARQHWGHGYATEGGRAAMEHAFESLGINHIISVIHPDNRPSIQVAERLGETFERAARVLREFEVVIYGRSRD